MLQTPEMQEPKIHVEKLELATLYNNILQGQLQIPRFQRDFVWPISKTQALLDSMYKEFPIGTFFFWRAPKDHQTLFRELSELNIPKPPEGFPVSYILDGQQRLTSLYVTLSGLKLGSRDYGRICIDLKKAAEFETRHGEDYNENIFVTRTPDNRRFIALQDLVGAKSTQISRSIPDDWADVFVDAGNRFRTYPFSVVWVRDQPLGEVVEIFQRINQGGKRLSRYDLVAANVWTPNFDFRRRVQAFNKELARLGFGKIDPTIVTQSFALILEDKCTTATELKLKTADIENNWEDVIKSLLLAIDFANSNLGVNRADFLPYRGILVVLAYFFYHSPTSSILANYRNVIWKWFWQVSLSERYSSTSPTRMAEDAIKLRQLFEGKEPKFDYRANASGEAVARVRMTSTTSALRNTILCLLTLKQPLNFKDGSPVNLSSPFFSSLTKAERHHIFPVAYLHQKGFTTRDVHRLANFCFIPANLNKEISSQNPAKYFKDYHDANPNFERATDSHLIPVDGNSPIWQNDYNLFIQARSNLIAEWLNQMLVSDPLDLSKALHPEGSQQDKRVVELIESQIREIIHVRLSAVAGADYWDSVISQKTLKKVRDRIQKKLEKHPYLSWSDFPPGEKYLEECDVSDYIKIIQNNWSDFSIIFGDQNSLVQHFESFRIYRNNVAHNKSSNAVEKKMAEAAILWIQQSLDKFSNDTDDDPEASEGE